MPFCVNCGKEKQESFSFCPYCGKNQSEEKEKNTITSYPSHDGAAMDEDDENLELEEYHDIKTQSKMLIAKGKYLGGHTMHPTKKEIKTNVMVRKDSIFIEKIFLTIPYSQMTNIENMDDKKISKLRVIGLGLIFLPLIVVGILWKKKKLYTVIEYDDGIQQQTVIIDFGKNVEKIQQAIYTRMIESRSKTH